jgi:hypothetical protein
MKARIRFGPLLILVGFSGCAGAVAQPDGPVDPEVTAALAAHWEALWRDDWRAAYEQIHPDVKAKGLTLRRFTDLHAGRRYAKGPGMGIKIAGSDRTGDDMTVSFDLLSIPAGALSRSRRPHSPRDPAEGRRIMETGHLRPPRELDLNIEEEEWSEWGQ